MLNLIIILLITIISINLFIFLLVKFVEVDLIRKSVISISTQLSKINDYMLKSFIYGIIYPLSELMFNSFYILPFILIFLGILNLERPFFSHIHPFVLVLSFLTFLNRVSFYSDFGYRIFAQRIITKNFNIYLFVNYYYLGFIIFVIIFTLYLIVRASPQELLTYGICFLAVSFPFRYNRWLFFKEKDIKELYRKKDLDDFRFYNQSILKSINISPSVWILIIGVIYRFIYCLFRSFPFKKKSREYYKVEARIFFRLEKYNKVLKIVDKGTSYLTESREQPSITLFSLKALSQANLGEPEKALKMLEEVKRDNPGIAYIHFYLGYVYWLLDEIDEALKSNQEAIDKDESCAFGWRNKAFLLCKQALSRYIYNPVEFNNNLDKALDAIKKAQTVSNAKYKNYAMVIHTLGYIYLLKGCYNFNIYGQASFLHNTKSALDCILKGIIGERHHGSRFNLSLLFLIGRPNVTYMEFHLKKILYELRNKNTNHKFYKMVQKNYERSIFIKNKIEKFRFNPNIVLYHLVEHVKEPYIFDSVRAYDDINQINRLKHIVLFTYKKNL